MKIKNINLIGVGSDLQLGKNGLLLRCSSGVIKVINASGTLSPFQSATPVNSDDVVTKGFYDTQSVKVYNASGTLQTGVKVIALTATTDSSGNWSVSLPSLGQTSVVNVLASAISPSSSNAIDMVNAHILTFSTTSVTGWSTRGAAVLVGGNTVRTGPSGVTVNVMIWVK